MAVIINLKELFASDAQEMYVDKVNFNFNKLLELGIGQPGPQGITGPLGSAGPIGVQGVPGERGNKWYTGTGAPSGQTFTGLLLNDFYLDTSTNSIYQYQGSPASWIQISDFSSIVNGIINSSGTPFVRGFGETSPDDQRYITFTRHGNDLTDQILDITLGNPSSNDIFLLNNWNEKHLQGGILNFPNNTDEEFNAIQHISVDHSSGTATGRYHLEFGSIYKDSNSDNLISNLYNNLKIRYVKQVQTPSYYSNSNETINLAKISLGLPESVVDLNANTTQQGIFLLDTPLYNIEDSANPVKGKLKVNIGTTEPIKEISQLATPVDGIEINTNDLTGRNDSVAIGLLRKENHPNWTLPFGIDGTLYTITKSNSVGATIIEGDTYSYDGSLNYMHTESKVRSNENLRMLPYQNSNIQGWQGIVSDGKYLLAVSPGNKNQQIYTDNGSLLIYDVTNPDDPILIKEYETSSSTNGNTPAPSEEYDIHGTPSGNGPIPGYPSSSNGQFLNLPLTGARDVAFKGDYGYIVRRKPDPGNVVPPPGVNQFTDSFLVFNLGSDLNFPKIVSWLGTNNTFSPGSSKMDKLRRVKTFGNWAMCITDSESVNADSYLLAVDVSNPKAPIFNNSNSHHTFSGRHIDFDIDNEVAYILSIENTGGTQENSILTKVGLTDPFYLNTAVSTSLNMTLNTPIPANLKDIGGIKAVGKKVYTVHGNRFFIYNSGERLTTTPIQLSNTYLPQDHYGTDVDVVGNYAYIYATNDITKSSCILIYDISDIYSPVLLDPITYFGSGSGKSLGSKFTTVGNRIYTVSARHDDGQGNLSPSGVNSIHIGGISSPSANLAKISASEINVSKKINISNDLDVGNSISVGSGGINVNGDAGISTSTIIAKPQLLRKNQSLPLALGSKSWMHKLNPGNLAYATAIWGNQILLEDIDVSSITFNAFDLPKVAGLVININNVNTYNYPGSSSLGSFVYGIRQDQDSQTTSNGTTVINDFSGAIRNLDDNTQENGIYFFGTDNNCASTYDANIKNIPAVNNTPDQYLGQWGIEYVGSQSDTDPNVNGLNFWKPSPSHNPGNFKLFLTDGGRIGINTGTPQYTLDVNGDINANGGITATGPSTINNFSSNGVDITGGSITGQTSWDSSGSFNQQGTATIATVGGFLGVGTAQSNYSTTGTSGSNNQHHVAIYTWTNSNQSGDLKYYNRVVNTSNVFHKLAVNGYIYGKGIHCASDKRDKDHITYVDSKEALSVIEKLNPAFYKRKSNGLLETGFYAQDVKEILPEAVLSSDNEEENLILSYNQITTCNTSAIQELNNIIKEKDKKINDLESRLAAIEEKIGL